MLAISALVRAPKSVMTPARTQTPRSSSGEPICAAMTPGLRKMPEPMTPPTTIMIVVKRPREGRRAGAGRGVTVLGFLQSSQKPDQIRQILFAHRFFQFLRHE